MVAQLRDDPAINRVRVRSVLTCEAQHGVCAACYGQSLVTGERVELGDAVGVIAAKSIGESASEISVPMAFPNDGGCSEFGLSRIVELFEARSPEGAAVLAHHSGEVRLSSEERGQRITVVAGDVEEESVFVSSQAQLVVSEAQEVAAGDLLVDGPINPQELLEIAGARETQRYLIEEVQKVYRSQGISIHDKHIELIVRQMLRLVVVADPGDSSFRPGQAVDSHSFAETNTRLTKAGDRAASGRLELTGITSASLATHSWLSAATFRETTRVLTEAAIEGRTDHLVGLKEAVIVGKRIPAGSGIHRRWNSNSDYTDAVGVTVLADGFDDESGDLAVWLQGVGWESTEPESTSKD